MLSGRRIVVVLPAYNAETTLRRTIAAIDRSVVDEIILVDDASTDDTVGLAEELGLAPTRHSANRGYGANQKTCYERALAIGADVVIMVHPDYQYAPELVPALAAMVVSGQYDLVLGSRILAQSAVRGGMPRWKYLANRVLTLVENLIVGAKLSEYHTGLRAYSASLLEALPLEHNSDNFVFDNQVIAQTLARGGRIGEISCPTRYEAESSSISFRASVRYGFGVLRTACEYRLHRLGLRHVAYLEMPPIAKTPSSRPVSHIRAS